MTGDFKFNFKAIGFSIACVTVAGCGKPSVTSSPEGIDTELSQNSETGLNLASSSFSDIYDCAKPSAVVSSNASVKSVSKLSAGEDLAMTINNINEVSPKIVKGALLNSKATATFFCHLKGFATAKVLDQGRFFSPHDNFVYSWDPKLRSLIKIRASQANQTIKGIQCSAKLHESCSSNRQWIFTNMKLSVKWSSVDLLAPRGEVLTAAIGGNLVISGPEFANELLNRVDIYSAATRNQSALVLPTVQQPIFMTIAGSKAIFVQKAGRQVDTYDFTSKKFSSAQLTSGSSYWTDRLIGATFGSKVLIAGQTDSEGEPSKQIDIYDFNRDEWKKTELSSGRIFMSSVTVGSKVFFAGGKDVNSNYIDTVEIYDLSKDSWSKTKLPSRGRTGMGAAATVSQVFFAGGNSAYGYSDTVDVFDIATNRWSLMKLSLARMHVQAVAAGSKVLFIGGNSDFQVASDVVDIYDTATKQWSSSKLSVRRALDENSVVKIGNKVVIAGGYLGSEDRFSGRVDIYDADSNTWSTTDMLSPVHSTKPMVVGSKIYFAGGFTRKPFDSNQFPSSLIQILEFH